MASHFQCEITRVGIPPSALNTVVARVARATDSYPVGHWFKSSQRYIWILGVIGSALQPPKLPGVSSSLAGSAY